MDWVAPDFNHSPITDYDIRYKRSTRPDSDYRVWRPQDNNYQSTFYTITGLEGNAEYDVQVRASNLVDESDWSNAGTGSTRNTAPRIISFEPEDSSIPATQSTLFTVIANDLEGDQLFYTFSLPHETTDDDHGSLSPLEEFNTATYTAPNTPGMYTVRVLVSDNDTDLDQPFRDFVITVTDATPPRLDAPTVSPHDDPESLIIRWSEPTDYEGPSLSYNVRFKLSGRYFLYYMVRY